MPTQDESSRIGYIMSRFPKLTETFILYEILSLERHGVAIEIYPLHREKCPVLHPEVTPLLDRANFTQLLSWEVVVANLYWLICHPIAYLGAWATCLYSTIGSARYFVGSLAVVPLAAAIARKMRRDGVVHVHAHFASHPAATAFVIRRLTGIPFSFTAHGSDLHRESRMLREKVDECRFAIAISEYNRGWIIRECGERSGEKTHVVHCGVDPEKFTRSPRSPESPDRVLQVVCIGSLHEVKGQSFLIRACAELRNGGERFQLHLVGDGPDREQLTKLVADEGIKELTKFHGGIARPAVIQLLADADVLVAPSVHSSDGRREGIPVVLMEAMASSLPVVASRISGIPELVSDGETGLLTTPGDSSAVAAALRRLAADPALRRRFGEAGRARICRDFHLHHETAKLAQLFGHDTPSTDSQETPYLAEASV